MYKIPDNTVFYGEIKRFPVAIVQRMCECQVEQGNSFDYHIFEHNRYSSTADGGFNWGKTPEDYNFWNMVISERNFSRFFKTYHSQHPKEKISIVAIAEIQQRLFSLKDKLQSHRRKLKALMCASIFDLDEVVSIQRMYNESLEEYNILLNLWSEFALQPNLE